MDLNTAGGLEMLELTTDCGTAARLRHAIDAAEQVDGSADFDRFVARLRERFPWRFQLHPDVLRRDYLGIVKQHLQNLIPRMQPYMDSGIRRVLDFGCGSGGSSIALALAYPEVRCFGTDIDAAEIEVAKERAALYGVADRCEFFHVDINQELPFAQGSFDLSLCSSVLEYAVQKDARMFCVQQMVRAVSKRGLLFFSVPNRIYPFEIHTGKWGWNYFPRWLGARTVDCGFWEVQRLARPEKLRLYRCALLRLLTPWTSFCLRKGLAD